MPTRLRVDYGTYEDSLLQDREYVWNQQKAERENVLDKATTQLKDRLTELKVPRATKKPKKHRYGSGTVYKQPGSPYWYIAYWHGSKQIRESSKTEDRRQAEKLLTAKVADLQRGLILPGSQAVTFAHLEDLFALDYQRQERRSADKAKGRINNHLRPFFSTRKPAELTETDLDQYIIHRQEEGAANGSINRELAILSRMFTLAARRKILSSKPNIPKLKEAPPREGTFTDAELARLLPKLPPYLRDPVLFAYYTSWRLAAEVFTLTWDDVDREKGIITLQATYSKNGEARDLPYTALPDLVTIIDRQWTNRKENTPLVFHRAGHQLVKPYKAWRKACQAAGLSGRLFHDLRRSGVTNLIDAGVDYKTAMAVSGHKDMSVFARYRIVKHDTVRQALSRLSKETVIKPS